MEKFEKCIEEVLAHEGGYVDNPDDPGGETNFGITAETADNAGYYGTLKEMTRDDAIRVYQRMYWKPEYEELPLPLAFNMLDAAVHSGHSRPTKWLQLLVGAKTDGVLGPETLKKVKAAEDTSSLVTMFCIRRLRFLMGLGTWEYFSKGWTRRVLTNMEKFYGER